MNSMTGFGRGSATVGATTMTVEMRSVNNRFLEVVMRLPRVLTDRETDIQNLVRAHLDRGRVSLTIQHDASGRVGLPVHVNADAARAYAALLRHLADTAGIDAPLTLENLLRFSDVFTTDEPAEDNADEAWRAAQEALAKALGEMNSTRHQEGEALRADLESRVGSIETYTDQVEARAPERVTEARIRLVERLELVFEDDRINTERIEQEIALLADKLDVTEECVRLRAHLLFFREALAATEPAGRRLNFLVQEIGREINTIGSKANDTEIAHLAVSMKEEMEKIREQVQNVE